ncbi:hypothetical protein [Arthrobacter sp. StoSoilB13]|uniref:hypothetical protein n=1 Tax=Arthrobacter sp. StoSoilB13 TaxID=2830993 RepID=UPI001CC64107|nr:hypothetical protein [Arthrobacter sp. StoSoilB13]
MSIEPDMTVPRSGEGDYVPKLARGEYVIRAQDVAQLEHERRHSGVLGILEAHPDWAHVGDDNMVFCVGCDYEEAPVSLSDAPRKFREHQARMIPSGQALDIDAEEQLIECLFRGYKTLGFDTDGDKTGMEMLARAGLGGNNLAEFIRLMDHSFAQAREDMAGAR